MLVVQKEMTFMVIFDFVEPQTCNSKLLCGLCRYLLMLKAYLAINYYFVLLFRGFGLLICSCLSSFVDIF